MKLVSALSQSLFPESVRNLIESANSATRIIRKNCEGTERAVTGIDELSTVMLRKQKERLLIELTPKQHLWPALTGGPYAYCLHNTQTYTMEIEFLKTEPVPLDKDG